MELCLGINDDIQQTFNRYEKFKKNIKPAAFESAFLNDYKSLNLNTNKLNNKNNTEVLQKFNDKDNSNNININNNNKNIDNEKRDYTKDLNDIFS